MPEYLDNFTAANGTQLDAHTSDSGHTYTTNPDFKINDNKLYCPDTDPYSIMVVSYTSDSEFDVIVEVDLKSAVGALGFFICADDTRQNAYLIRINAGDLEFWRYISGAGNKLYDAALPDSAPATGTLLVEVRASDIKLYWNGSLQYTSADTTHARAGRFHYYGFPVSTVSGGVHFDSVHIPPPANVLNVTGTGTAHNITPEIFDGTVWPVGTYTITVDEVAGPGNDTATLTILPSGDDMRPAFGFGNALPMRPTTTVELGRVIGSGEARAMGYTVNVPFTPAAGSGQAHDITPAHSLEFGGAGGTGTAHDIIPRVPITVDTGNVAGSGTAHPIVPDNPIAVALGRVIGNGEAHAITFNQFIEIGRVIGTGSAERILPNTGAELVPFAPAAGSGQANDIVPTLGVSASIGPAAGSGFAHPIVFGGDPLTGNVVGTGTANDILPLILGLGWETELQRTIYRQLVAEAPSLNIYDDVPQKTSYPYVSIGEVVHTEFNTDTELGMSASVIIHTWSRERGRKETKQMQNLVYNALNRRNLIITGYHFISCEFVDSQTFVENDGKTRHGVQEFVILYDEE